MIGLANAAALALALIPSPYVYMEAHTGQFLESHPPGTPWSGPIPNPTRVCNVASQGQQDLPNVPWWCGAGMVSQRPHEWTWVGVPPLQACTRALAGQNVSGYICSIDPSTNTWRIWWPEQRK